MIDWTKKWHLAQGRGKRQCEAFKPTSTEQRRRSATLLKPVLRDQHCQSRGQKINRNTRDQRIAPKGDRGNPVKSREQK